MILAVGLAAGCASKRTATLAPIRLHPANPHYFEWRGKPAVIVTSAEHYGAVLNLDFDYVRYLDTLQKEGLNNTRTFTGAAYVEPQGAFQIERNTLAPAPGRYAAPWARSGEPGYAGGGNKFDLAQWDESYFARFRDFVARARERGVVVEVNLFCPMYEEAQWRLSPFNAINNVNGLGNITRTNVFTLDRHGGLLAVQERFVRRIVEELKGFDNVYYEICNEPYFGGVTLEWQHHIADVITEAQRLHPGRKLISQNIANNQAKVDQPHPDISILNFHYAAPPDTVAMNYGLGRVIGDNETGFRGTNDAPYRMEGWDFMVAGGGLFNHLDFSFAAGYEDGTFVYPASQPGGGNPAFRVQMRILKDFIESFDFIRMRPDNSVILPGLPASLSARALVEPGAAYAVYLRPWTTTRFSARWTGTLEPRETGDYTFYAGSNDGARLWVDGRLVVDNWVEQGEQEASGTVRLEGGRRHALRIEYFYNGGQAAMKLRWSGPGLAKSIVPAEVLRTSEGTARGLKGEYFQGTDLTNPWRTRTDERVDFSWGTSNPFEVPTPGGAGSLTLEMPRGDYRADWIDPVTGAVVKQESFKHGGGPKNLEAPVFKEDMALRIKAR